MTDLRECPLANLSYAPEKEPERLKKCPFHVHHNPAPDNYTVTNEVPLNVRGGTHHPSANTAQLLADIGGGDRIREFVTRFYARAFLDQHIKSFFFLDDGATQHGKRLGDWIIQKMGGEGEPWTESGRWGMRQPAHSAAWHNEKRDPSVRGQHFQLDDCRVWMRLHFWAARECGLDKHESFWTWYVQFIEHFISVYERTAPPYAASDAEWSANPENLALYEKQGYFMADVVGKKHRRF
jgi:hypothetical protein